MITQFIAYTAFLIGFGFFGGIILTEFKKQKRRRFVQLKREQEYPIVFTKKKLFNKIKTKTRFSASMIDNNFTNIKTGELINTQNYTGFIIFGNTTNLNICYGNHGDLIFVKKQFKEKDLKGEYVVVSKENNYVLGKVKSVIKNKQALLDNRELIDITSIVGPVEFDFNIKL